MAELRYAPQDVLLRLDIIGKWHGKWGLTLISNKAESLAGIIGAKPGNRQSMHGNRRGMNNLSY